jgi:crotonobetainyl-CoA:carnitine CoA-transferase CaiB-like acyl-CoA transferase
LLLADLGADVIKIEPLPSGDRTRQLTGFASGFFATFNRNKRSVMIDLKTAAGQLAIHRLVKTADVIVENYGPGTMERLGCGWDELRALNPRLVYLALKGFLNGPWQNRPALDEVVQFQSGLAYMTGPAGQPLRAGASIVDILGAVFGVTAVLAALRERDSSGQGQRVGSALFESAVFLMGPHMAGGAATGETVPPMTERKGAWGIYDVFTLTDASQLFIGVTSDAQWLRFCDAFKLGELADDTRLTTNGQRTVERGWLIPELCQEFSQRTYQEVIECCVKADISWSPVGRPEHLLTNEQLLAGGGLLATALATASGAVVPETLLPALPLEFGEQRQRPLLTRQPPAPGEHTEEILSAAGIAAGELAAMRQAGAVL